MVDIIYSLNSAIYFGSDVYAIKKSDILQNEGINHIINCFADCYYTALLPKTNFDLDEVDDLSFTEHVDDIVQKMHQLVNDHLKIYVHSFGTSSVHYAVLVYYLMTYEKLSYDAAYQKLQAIDPSIEIAVMFTDLLQLIDD